MMWKHLRFLPKITLEGLCLAPSMVPTDPGSTSVQLSADPATAEHTFAVVLQ